VKILIVDDDPRLRDLVRLALERAGHAVVTAADGQAALVHAARESPDLIVLDVGLPEIDGFETCRRIRARSEVPILFLTAPDDEIDRIVGLELGADDYVTKPFSPRELVARVRAILKRRRVRPCRLLLRLGIAFKRMDRAQQQPHQQPPQHRRRRRDSTRQQDRGVAKADPGAKIPQRHQPRKRQRQRARQPAAQHQAQRRTPAAAHPQTPSRIP